MAVIAGALMIIWGLFLGVYGALALWLGNLDEYLVEAGVSAEIRESLQEVFREPVAGVILIIVGVILVLGGLLVWAHRGLGRAVGIVFGLLGTIAGIGIVLSTTDLTLGDITIAGNLGDDDTALAFAIFTLLTWLFIFLAMFIGRRHFRRRGVS
jgi:hypothetical protein